jgi:fatty-acyl-CoA synthase
VGRGDRVALLSDNRVEWVQVAFAAASLGAVLCPINTWVKTRDLDYLLGHSKPKVLVTIDRLGNQDFLTYLRELGIPGVGPARVVVLGAEVPAGASGYTDWVHAGEVSPLPDLAAPDDVALVLYTSGSTAQPKAVPLRHRHLIENGWAIGERQGLTDQDRVFLAAPLAWAYGSANAMMATFTHGSALVLQSTFEPAGALDLLRRQRCTSLYTLPVMTRALLDLPGFDPATLPDLRRGLTIGSPAELALVHDHLGVDQISNIYGSSEVYGNCCVTPHDAPFTQRAVSQGPPLDGVEVRIVDVETGALLPTGQVGEIRVRGRVTPGYLEADHILRPVVDEDGFFPTGDLGSLDADGWLTFAGRDSEVIKTSGINVSPAEVEEFLVNHPDVVEAAVVGAEVDVRGQAVIAFVRLDAAATVTPEDLRAWCKESIAGYKVPAAVIAIEQLPTTPTGKLARRELVRLAADHLSARA